MIADSSSHVSAWDMIEPNAPLSALEHFTDHRTSMQIKSHLLTPIFDIEYVALEMQLGGQVHR